MPPKPVSQSEADAEFYNIDFSYQTQLRLAAGQSPSALQSKVFIFCTLRLLIYFLRRLYLHTPVNTPLRFSNIFSGI